MENCHVLIALGDHSYCRQRRARKPAAVRQEHHRCASTAGLPRKRKRTSVAEPPEVVKQVPAPQPSIPSATISPSELPVVSKVAPSPQPSSAPLLDDGPLLINNYPVEEYQRIYHEVVDDMLRFKNGRQRPYSLELGRRIKQKLWERLNRPTFTSSVGEDGLVQVEVSYGVGVSPPHYDVDTQGEPKPKMPSTKRAKK